MAQKPLSEEKLGALMDARISDAIRWPNSKLSKERTRVLRYYNSELPKPQKEGSSAFVSSEVYDAVESMKAQLLETFAAGRDIIRFNPRKPQDIQQAAQQTAMASYAVFTQNDGYGIFSEAIHDGLTARVGVAKVWWDECHEMEDHEFEGLPIEQVEQLASSDEVADMEAEPDETTGMWSGKASIKRDTSQVRIEVINPEEFAIESQAKYLGPKYFCVHQTLKTRDDLLQMGYDKSKLADISPEGTDRGTLDATEEKLARFQQVYSGDMSSNSDIDPDMEWIVVSECYSKFKYKDDKHAKLYKVVRAGSQTLEVEAVDELPFVVFRPLPVPHAFHGNNFAARIIPYQNVRSALVRSVIDHTMVTNNPRWQVIQNSVTNPRELLDNRLGGIVNTKRPDAVVPLAQSPMNPYVFNILEALKAQNEQTTGISALSQGLNKDAISQQNSQGMVQDLVNLSQTRQKVIARNFANEFLIPLFIKVSNLIVRNAKQPQTIEVTGGFVEVDPRQWDEMTSATVSVHLGYGEQAREAMQRFQMMSTWTQDPMLGQMFDPPRRRKAAVDIAKMTGMMNAEEYLMPAEQLQPPQPDPFKIKEMENDTTKAQAALMTAQAALKKVEAHVVVEQSKEQYAAEQRQIDNQLKMSDDQRKNADIMNKIDIAQREMALAESTPNYEGKTLVSPN